MISFVKRVPLDSRVNVLLIPLIFLMALVLRILCITQMNGTPLAVPAFTVDAESYIQFALRMLQGDYFFKEITYQSPLYPFFLCGLFKLFGHSLTAVRVTQAVLDAAVPVLIYFVAEKLPMRKSFCLLAALIYAFYGLAIFYTGLIIDTTLSVFLHAAFVFLLWTAYPKNKPGLWFLTGLLAGLALLTKPFLVLFLLFFIFFYLTQQKDPVFIQRLKNLSFVFLGFLIILAPFSLRNYQSNKTWSPLQAYGGLRFFRANHPEAGGSYSSVPGLSDAPILEIQDAILEAERSTGEKMDAGSVSHFWFRKSFEFMEEQPGIFLKGLASKGVLFWNWREVGDNIDYPFSRSFIPLLRFPLFSFGMVAPWGLLGCCFAFFKKSGSARSLACLLICYMTAVILFAVTDRFRLPCVPWVILLGVFSADEFFAAVRSQHVKKVIGALVIFGLGLFFVHQQTIPGKVMLTRSYEGNSRYNLGVIYKNQKRFPEALKEFQEASALAPDHWPARNQLAGLYTDSGQFEKAFGEYQELLARSPGYAEGYNGLGRLFLTVGKPDQALMAFSQAILLKQDFAEAYNNLGVAYATKNQSEQAISAYRRGIVLDPLSDLPHRNLADLYGKLGRSEEAADELRKAGRLRGKSSAPW